MRFDLARRSQAMEGVNRLVVFASIVVACAVSTVDDPPREPPPPDEEEETSEVDRPEPAAQQGAAEPAPVNDRCVRAPRTEEIELPDGGATVVVYEECIEVPDRDLGDPSP